MTSFFDTPNNHSHAKPRSRKGIPMRGASGFAEVELKLSTNAARCEGLSYLLSFENIYKNIRMLFCNRYIAYSTQQRIRHMIVHFLYDETATPRSNSTSEKCSFSDCFKTLTVSCDRVNRITSS